MRTHVIDLDGLRAVLVGRERFARIAVAAQVHLIVNEDLELIERHEVVGPRVVRIERELAVLSRHPALRREINDRNPGDLDCVGPASSRERVELRGRTAHGNADVDARLR